MAFWKSRQGKADSADGKGEAETVMGGKPKHEALSDWIRDRILAGAFPIGSRLPSENELAKRFQLSRQTVRQAIGTLVRENLLEAKINSAAFEVDYADGVFTFTTYGYGHGVGMSQQGADYYAMQGWDYVDILTHYYTGTTVR